jgi:hypothetical protein
MRTDKAELMGKMIGLGIFGTLGITVYTLAILCMLRYLGWF